MKPALRSGLIGGAAAVVAALVWAARQGGSGPPDVVLVVLDTVRSDYLSLCGEQRPTAPTLERLRGEGAAWTCDAYAPGSWTLPSHASFFTGVPILEHHAHEITSGVKDFAGSSSRSRPLRKGLPTLAEEMTARGYTALALSGNPVINEDMGLVRGFARVRRAEEFGDLAGQALAAAVREELAELDADEPLFLFVNIAEAHQPWADIPAGVPWASPIGDRKLLKYAKMKPEDPWRQYVEGRLPPGERAAFDAKIDSLYAYNVFRADETLGLVLAELEAAGRCGAGCRLVVTSDHGEMLGEHQLLDHGHYTWESNVRVPFLVRGVDAAIEGPFNAIHAFHLARDGALPAAAYPPLSVAWPHVRRCYHTRGLAFCATSAALWRGQEKAVWQDNVGWPEPQVMRFDLASDPDEQNPLPLAADHPLHAELMRLAAATLADAGEDEESDAAVTEALRAAGYLE